MFSYLEKEWAQAATDLRRLLFRFHISIDPQREKLRGKKLTDIVNKIFTLPSRKHSECYSNNISDFLEAIKNRKKRPLSFDFKKDIKNVK